MSETTVPDPFTRRLGDDRGFMIVEVLVSALILLLVSAAVFTTLDKADQVAGGQQKRTLSANFAQSELERIRSLPVEDIAAMRGTRTIVRDKVTYTIETTAKWVSDGDDEPQCTSRTGGVDYMRLTVKVSWSNMGNAKPISMTTLFTPTAGAGGGETGSLSVHIGDRNGGPVVGVTVHADGPNDYEGITNKNGCVVFPFIPASVDPGYIVSFAKPGYVNAQSVNAVSDKATVTEGETTKLHYDYDSGGFTKVNFVTRRYAGEDNRKATPPAGKPAPPSPVAEIPSAPTAFQMFHAEQLTPDGITTTLNGSQTSWDGTGRPWFPFSSPYAVYAGDCPKNAVPSTDADVKFVNITPLVMQNAGTTYVPALDVKVWSGTSSATPALQGVGIRATVQVMADCNMIWSRTTENADTTQTIGGLDYPVYAGHLKDPGFPFVAGSTLRVCAYTSNDSSIPAGARLKKSVVQLTTNKNLKLGTPVDIYLGAGQTNSGGGPCQS